MIRLLSLVNLGIASVTEQRDFPHSREFYRAFCFQFNGSMTKIHTHTTSQEQDLRGLQDVRVSKDSLLGVIKENRVKHAQEYDVSYTGWKLEVVKQLEDDVTEAKRNYRKMLKQHKKIIADAQTRLKRTQKDDFKTDEAYFRTKKPVHHIEDYNGAIKKLELSLDSELELNSPEFNQFVMDQWQWKKDFETAVGARMATVNAYNNSIYDAPSGKALRSGSLSYSLTATSSPELFMTGSASTALLDGTYTIKGY